MTRKPFRPPKGYPTPEQIAARAEIAAKALDECPWRDKIRMGLDTRRTDDLVRGMGQALINRGILSLGEIEYYHSLTALENVEALAEATKTPPEGWRAPALSRRPQKLYVPGRDGDA